VASIDANDRGRPPDLRGSASRNLRERSFELVLLVAALVSIGTTLGVIASLATETVAFFKEVSIIDYFTGTEWTPLFSQQRFGVLALLSATILTSFIAIAVAVPLGLVSAIFLAEFAPPRLRAVLKPCLEVLAGIPTIVYGFFALTFVTPHLQDVIPGLKGFNSLSAGLVMGLMIIPMISSLSDDALSAVPRSLREAAYGLGSTKLEVSTRVVFPAAVSGVAAAVILAMSRAVGETMIVAIAAGQNPLFTLDPRVPVETMTTYIVQVSLGDTPAGSIAYETIFAVGATLFVVTLLMNIGSHYFVRKFREVYD
jgi:phosphate transport system permease protein